MQYKDLTDEQKAYAESIKTKEEETKPVEDTSEPESEGESRTSDEDIDIMVD